MDVMIESRSVEREIEIAARPETIWELLVDPKQATRWMGQLADFDVRKGGRYRLQVIPGHVASGEFVEIDPPRRLVYTWGWETGEGSKVPPGSTTVIFELLPRGNATLLRFTHRDLPGPEAAASHAHGWDHYFERLTIVASGGDAGVDPWIAGPMQ
jgi:uncharacterized protein YndB with AHSA1/START domain